PPCPGRTNRRRAPPRRFRPRRWDGRGLSGLPGRFEFLDASHGPLPEEVFEPEVALDAWRADKVASRGARGFVGGATVDDTTQKRSSGAIARVEQKRRFTGVLGERLGGSPRI